ncbi:MAG: hypothetical protein JXR37_30230 [Kiritimatiellae bacterium]|nr:hypothetical protein [Kiritimatiellia bacterium]
MHTPKRCVFSVCALFFFGSILLAACSAAEGGGGLPPDVSDLLRQWQPGRDNPQLVRQLNDLVDRNDAGVLSAFRAQAQSIGGGKAFEREVFKAIDAYQMQLATDLADEVASELGDGVEMVVRTGSSGDRHMNLFGGAATEGRYDFLGSDDDISFIGPKAEEAMKRFNQRRAAKGLSKARVKAFTIESIADPTSYDVLVKQLRDPDAFLGATGFGRIKKEMVQKGGAVIRTRQGGQLLQVSETLQNFIQKHPETMLADVMDLARIADDFKKFGPLTIYASCSRQLGHAGISDRERVKYLLRIYGVMEAGNAFGDAVSMGGRQSSYFRELGEQLMAAYGDKSGKAATAFLRRHDMLRIQTDAFESVMLSTCKKLQSMVSRAEREAGRGAVNIARHPELRRMIHELAAGFALLEDINHSRILEDIIPSMMKALGEGPNSGSLFYKVLRTAAFDAASLRGASREAVEEGLTKGVTFWMRAATPEGYVAGLKEAGAQGQKARQALSDLAGHRLPDAKGRQAAQNIAKLAGETNGDTFLWKLLSSEAGAKFATEAIVNAPFVLLTMYTQWKAGEMNDVHDAAFVLIDFVPMGMSIKRSICEGMSAPVVASFVTEALYFTPAWPLVLTKDVIVMSWTLGAGLRLQNESEGLVDVLTYNAEFKRRDDGGYTLVKLVLPGGTEIPRADIEKWLFSTKYVRVKHAKEGLDYRINNLSEKAWNVFNEHYAMNDPALQQMRQAAEQHLAAINWSEAERYFGEGRTVEGRLCFLAWMAGCDYIVKLNPDAKWAKLYAHLQKQMENRRDDIIPMVMVPQLIELAEQKYATLNAETDLGPPFVELQAKLEKLRGRPLEVILADAVRTRAKSLADRSDSAVFGQTQTSEAKQLTRGEYWEKAYQTYSAVLNRTAHVPESVKSRTGYAEARVLQFAWTGEYADDYRKCEQSRAGFAADIGKTVRDISRIKGAAPALSDAVDAQAFAILARVVFPWRSVLDEGDRREPGAGSAFFAEYEEALEQVRALYSVNAEFDARVKKGARIVADPHPLRLDAAAALELRFTDAGLEKEHQDGGLAVSWSAQPGGTFRPADAAGRTLRFAPDSPSPVLLAATVRRLGPGGARGVVQTLVPVSVPDDFLRVSCNPEKPWPGARVTCTADIPERFYSTGLDVAWSGTGCQVQKTEGYTTVVVAPTAGVATVQASLQTDGPDGARHTVAEKKVTLAVAAEGQLALGIDGAGPYAEGEDVVLSATVDGVPAAARAVVRVKWYLNGRLRAGDARFQAGKLPRGAYDVELRGSFAPKDGPAQTASVKAKVVVLDPGALLTVSVDGPTRVRVNADITLSAVLHALNPQGERVRKEAWLEWTLEDVVIETGDRLRPDTGRPGVYPLEVRAVSGEGLDVRVLARAAHTLEIVGSAPSSEEEEEPPPGEQKPAGGGKKTKPGKPAAGKQTAAPPAGTKPSAGEEPPTAPVQEISAAYAAGRTIAAEGQEATGSGVIDWRFTLPAYCHNGVLGFAFARGYDDEQASRASRVPALQELQTAYTQARLASNTDFGAAMKLYPIVGIGAVNNWVNAAYKDGYHWGNIARLEDNMPSMNDMQMDESGRWTVVKKDRTRPAPGAPKYRVCTHDPVIATAWHKGWADGYGERPQQAPSPAECGYVPQVGPKVTLRLTPDKGTLARGETVKLLAWVENTVNEDDPLSFAWTGATKSSEGTAEFTPTVNGTFTVVVKVTGAGGRALGQASATFGCGDLQVTVEGIPREPVPVGSTASLNAKVQIGGKATQEGGLEFSWQPHPEVEWTGRAGASAATARFLRPQKVRVWVDVLRREGAVAKTVASSEPVEVEVVPPKLTLECSPASPLVGEEVKLKLGVKPELPELDCRWDLPANVKRVTESKDSREIVLYTLNTQPATVRAMARLQHYGDDLGEVKAAVTAKPYQVAVIGPRYPGPKPRVWSEAAKGLVEVDSGGTVMNQEVFFSVSVAPQPARTVRYEWRAAPEGCSVYSPGSRETRVSAGQPGSYTLSVKVTDDRGIELGAGSGRLSVAADSAKTVTVNVAAELAKARAEASQGRLDEAIERVGGLARAQPRNTDVASLQANLTSQRRAIQEALRRFDDAVAKGTVDDARNALRPAQQQNARYGPVVTAAQTLEAMERKQREFLARVAEARQLEGKNDLAGALAKYEAALALVPDGAVRTKITQLKASIKAAAERAENEKKAGALVAEGRGLEQNGDVSGALAKYKAAHQLNPTDALAKQIRDAETRLAAKPKTNDAPVRASQQPPGKSPAAAPSVQTNATAKAPVQSRPPAQTTQQPRKTPAPPAPQSPKTSAQPIQPRPPAQTVQPPPKTSGPPAAKPPAKPPATAPAVVNVAGTFKGRIPVFEAGGQTLYATVSLTIKQAGTKVSYTFVSTGPDGEKDTSSGTGSVSGSRLVLGEIALQIKDNGKTLIDEAGNRLTR